MTGTNIDSVMSGPISALRACKPRPMTELERILSDQLFAAYCQKSKHKDRLTQWLLASLRAAANRVARHGPPPNKSQRLAYRMHKKRRAKLAAIALYGDPSADCPTPREVPAKSVKPPTP